MATTMQPRAFMLPFKQKALADRIEQAEAAIDHLAKLGIIELPKPITYWQTEFRALLAAFPTTTTEVFDE
jgi:hypothetical protein